MAVAGVQSSGTRQADRRHDGARVQRIATVQRARMLAAVTWVACEDGAANVTVAGVVDRAGVSRRTFYDLFDSVEECLLAAIEDAVNQAGAGVMRVYEASAEDWQTRIRAALTALLAFFDERPLVARLLVVEWLGAGVNALCRRRELMAALTEIVDEERTEPHVGERVSPLTGEAVVGATVSVLHNRLVQTDSAAPLIDLLNPLMSFIVLPYLGPDAAGQQLLEQMPQIAARERRDGCRDVFRSPGVRLTYRTVRVLAALASHPGASNRVLAEAADIRDQGQISKLLKRLQAAGLVQNAMTDKPLKPNAWSLTPRGERLERSLRA